MSELQVLDVCRVSALAHRDDVVNRGAPRVRKYQVEVDGSPADSANRLRTKDYFLGFLKAALFASMVCSVRLDHLIPSDFSQY